MKSGDTITAKDVATVTAADIAAAAVPKSAAPAPKVQLAHLDPDGLLLTYELVEAQPDPWVLPPLVKIVPLGCDHKPGKARWNEAKGAWEVVSPPTPEQQVMAPNALRAIAGALRALSDGKSLPAESLAWLDWQERSTDGAADSGKAK
jgi:hypothetical protein